MSVKRKADPTWAVVLACFLMGFFFLGFCSGNKSLYLSAVTEALQVPRSLFSLNDTVRYLTTAGVNLVFAGLLHRLGVRKMVALGALFLVIQCVLSGILFHQSAASVGRSVVGENNFISHGMNRGVSLKSIGQPLCTGFHHGFFVVHGNNY